MSAMAQAAPYPELLAGLVEQLTYRPGWTVRLVDDLDRGQGSAGLTLVITTCGYDSYHHDRGQTYRVNHYMPVPPAAYDERSWRRWLLDQFLLVERHEAHVNIHARALHLWGRADGTRVLPDFGYAGSI